MKILVVDDEKLLVKGIKFNLENEGYEVSVAYDGEEAVKLARTGDFDLIILDIMMPKLNGMDACIQIRKFSQIPIIMLTAKDEDMDKLLGFDNGTDDYLTKPFNILELKARVRALLRRTSAAEKRANANRIACGDIVLDTGRHNAYKNGCPVDLTARDFNLLELLMRNPGHVYSREDLLNLIWGYEYEGEIRAVDVHVRQLREKLERVPAQPEYIMTKRGVGYYFKAESLS